MDDLLIMHREYCARITERRATNVTKSRAEALAIWTIRAMGVSTFALVWFLFALNALGV